LKRFYVPPTDNTNYKIFTPGYLPTDTSAPWIINTSSLSNIVANGVIAFWVRCYDRNDDLIPGCQRMPPEPRPLNSIQLRIFSQPRLLLCLRQTSNTPTQRPHGPIFFPRPSRITIVTLDLQTFRRNPTISPQTAQITPNDLGTVSATFSQQLITNHISSAHMFSTRVNLVNSGQ